MCMIFVFFSYFLMWHIDNLLLLESFGHFNMKNPQDFYRESA